MSVAAALARPEILALEPYSHAAWNPALERLNANENPWRGPADASRAGLNRYPEPYPVTLEVRLAALYGVHPQCLIAGRGSDEGIDLLVRAFCVPGRDAVLICPPTFGMYAVSARIQGAEVIEVPLAARFAVEEAALAAALTPAVKLVFLCSPNNPTGNALEPPQIERIARRLGDKALLVVDEAYAEFSRQRSALALLIALPNLVVLRTLSKAYALAGARVGALIGARDVVALLRRIVPPYSIASPSSEAALDALAHAPLAAARERVATVIGERARLAVALGALPGTRTVWPSEANFLLVEFADPAAVLERARAAGFLLRDFSHGPLTPACRRISVGTPDQNDRLLAGLRAPQNA